MPDPFTTADKLQAQRLQQALATARKSLDDGEIDDVSYQGLLGMIRQRLAPLLERQQQADADAEEQQQQQVTKKHAQMQAMEQQAAVFRAQNFMERIVPIVDPLTGRVARMFESKPGYWEEIEFKASKNEPKPEEPTHG